MAFVFFSFRQLRLRRSRSFRYVVTVNIVLTIASVLLVVLLLESYYGFFYDETDSYGLLLTYERWFRRHYRLNNLGFRDDKDYLMPKQRGKQRIVFIGDSYTAGHGIKNINDRFSGLIEKKLYDAGSGSYEVYTIARNGWDTNNYLSSLLLLAEGNFETDTIILCYTMNDIGWASPESGAMLESIYSRRPENWLLNNSYFLNFLYWRIKVLSADEAKDYYGWLSRVYEGKAWDMEQMALGKIVEGCKVRGWRLKAVILPLIGDLSNGFRMKAGHSNVSAFFGRHGIPYIDLSDRLKTFPPDRMIVNRYDSHPNEAAHEIIADEIWNRLLDKSGRND